MFYNYNVNLFCQQLNDKTPSDERKQAVICRQILQDNVFHSPNIRMKNAEFIVPNPFSGDNLRHTPVNNGHFSFLRTLLASLLHPILLTKTKTQCYHCQVFVHAHRQALKTPTPAKK
ncbi:hypothetical protein CDAR_621671 [Caerostris darwini]|uniref:Uncharacterized protein n=1 Tax=Caerostris darwini TaxID=1538125 RepID=A0AAV4P800_9ARAC|nr:hypothetical protein CDAR_621671 [Caerostris darwini]